MVFNKFISHCRPILIYLHLDSHITSLDFSPNGETVATIDDHGVCLISDLNTDSYHFHLNMEMMNSTATGKQNFQILDSSTLFCPLLKPDRYVRPLFVIIS